MAKQLNINLGFTANTSQAKQSIMELQSMLSQLITSSASQAGAKQLPLTKQLVEAQTTASQLRTIIQQTTNVNTGKLDLSRFSESLKSAGLNITTLRKQLDSLGPNGQKAFLSLAQSIMAAEVPLTRTSRLATELWSTLKNTARWQLSSSVLHGFVGTLQSAYGYATDLNESLNKIRIVTGQSVEEMARFADEANKAARALSTTTTEYTNASLIYYQQGLSVEEVKERTDITIKMANAAGVSAETASDQLTAVWNNFDNGTKSLEYYVDVMTALGAATASSTDEIAGGLEKFAAIADTIGLSYEYATAALATLTSNTRQSEEIVGTALRTMFARIQGLKLGETLDDGTTLNQYSEALQKVGIDILDQNNELKKMDIILDEMAAKWDTLSNAQQTALAQTVAGVRQYTQLVALMENWDKDDEDSFLANLTTARESEGALQEQADIYAESWEAASDRVAAAAEDIYDSILNDEFFISLFNGFEKALNGVSLFTDAINGLPGILSLVGVLFTKIFQIQLANSIDNAIYGLRSLIGVTQQAAEETRNLTAQEAANIQFNTGTAAGDVEGVAMQRRLDLQTKIREVSKDLPEIQRAQLEGLLEINDAYAQQAILAAQAQDKATEKMSTSNQAVRTKIIRSDSDESITLQRYRQIKKEMQSIIDAGVKTRNAFNKVNAAFSSGAPKNYEQALKRITDHLESYGQTGTAGKIKELTTKFQKGQISAEGFQHGLNSLITADELLGDASVAAADKLREQAGAANLTIQECDELALDMTNLAVATADAKGSMQAYTAAHKKFDQSIQTVKQTLTSYGESVVKTMNGISSLSMALQSFSGIWDTLQNEDLSFWEKTLSVTMSLSMAIPMLVTGITTLAEVKKKKVIIDGQEYALGIKTLATSILQTAATWAEAKANAAETASLWGQVAAWLGVQAAAAPVLVLTLAIVAATGALVGIGALVVIAAQNIERAYNANAKAAEEAKAQVELLNDAYTELISKAQELNDAISDYQDARNALLELELGTAEYAKALDDANEKARALIETHRLWDSYTIDNGLISIDPDALTQVQMNNNSAAQRSENILYGAKIYNEQAQLKAFATQQARNVTGIRYEAQTDLDDELETHYRSLYTREFEWLANYINNLPGVNSTEQIQDSLAEFYKNNQVEIRKAGLESDIFTQLNTVINDDTLPLFKAYNDSQKEAIMANKEYARTIMQNRIQAKYGSSFNALATKDGVINTAMVANLEAAMTTLANSDEWATTLQNANNAMDIYNVISNADLRSKIRDDDNAAAIEALFGISANELNIKDDESLARYYGQLMGYGNAQTFSYKSGTGEGTLIDASGNEYAVNDEWMRKAIAQAIAEKNAELTYGLETKAQYEALESLMTHASASVETFGVDFSTAILNAIANENYSSLDFSALFTELDPAEMAKLTGLDDQGILKLIGLTPQNLQDLGYSTTRSFTDAFAKALTLWEYNLDTSKIEEQATSLQDIIEKSTVGSAISKEQHQTLLDLGIDTERYFTKMADGTYVLTAAADDFIQVLKGLTAEDYISKIQEFRLAQTFAANQLYDTAYVNKGYQNEQLIQQALTTTDLGSFNEREWRDESRILANIRADYLRKIGADNLGLTSEQSALLDVNKLTFTQEEMQELANMMTLVARKDSELQSQFLSQAKTLSELNQKTKELQRGIGAIDYDAYGEALILVASQYEVCHNAIEQFNKALNTGDSTLINAAQNTLEASILLGESAETYNLNADLLQTHTELLNATHSKLSIQDAAKLAIENARVNKGVEELIDNWEQWNAILTTGNQVSEEYAETIYSLQDTIRNLTGVHADFAISTEFITNNLKLLEAAALSDEKAIQSLGLALGKDVFNSANLINSPEYARIAANRLAQQDIENYRAAMSDEEQDDLFEEMLEGKELSLIDSYLNSSQKIAEQFEITKTTLLTGIDELQTLIKNNQINIGDAISGELGTDWIQALNDMAMATQMTEQEMNSILSSLGMSADVFIKDVTTETSVPSYAMEGSIGTDGTFSMSAVSNGYTTIPTKTQVATIGNPATVKYVGNEKINTITPKGTSSPKKDSQLAEIERYKEITDQLDILKDKYNDLNKEADRLYGSDRLSKIQEQNKLLADEIALLNEKKSSQEALRYLSKDQEAVDNALAAMSLGLTFDYGEEGRITNYREVMEQARKAALGDETKSEQFSDLLDAINQYDKTREIIRDTNNKIVDSNNTIQDNNYTILVDNLNYKLEDTEELLRSIDFDLSLLEDDFYSVAEAATLMLDKKANYESLLDAYITGSVADDSVAGGTRFTGGQLELLQNAFANKQISETDYIDGLKNSRDAIYDNLEALVGLDKQMLDYYGNTLAAAGEEIGKYTTRMDHLTDVLDHYSSLLKLIGKEKDYEAMAKVLRGTADTLKNSLEVSKAEYNFYKEEAEAKEALYLANKDTEAGELFKREWEAAEEAMRESQNRMLTGTKEWAEAEKAVIENAMKAAAASLEKSLTDGETFDFLTTRLDHAVSIQEEYLTTTNKIYETTKLMRTAQQAIDASTNATTKQKLKNFITETQQLQDQTDLSKYELEIQQAKYDLLLAEIALEDAQNAKSMVRLKRDSEGNFGYVYTADENEVADAQQKLDDAENNLYNIALRGAEDYTTKSIEIRQELWEKLQEIDEQYRNGAFASEEEYQKQRDELVAYYTRKLEDYSKLYGIAIETHPNVAADSWSTAFSTITTDTEKWNESVSGYLDASEQAFKDWSAVVSEVQATTGKDLDALAEKVDAITEESKTLKEELIGEDGKGGVLKAIQDETKAVSDQTSAYANQRDELLLLTGQYQKFITEINTTITKLKEYKALEDLVTPPGTDTDNPPPEGNTDNSPPTTTTDNTTAPTIATTTDYIGRTVLVSDRLANGAPISDARKKDMGIDGWLTISGTKTINGKTQYEVKNSAGKIVGSFMKEELWPISQFASGGYTGEWGPEGKLAMLHQKELVLNQQDTSNLLAAVEMLRVILETLDIHTMSAQIGGFLSSPNYYGGNDNSLNQNVTIEASFPGVTDRYELEEAFHNLINKASQYANRK